MIISLIVLFCVMLSNTSGMNLMVLICSSKVLQRILFSIVEFPGDILSSYANVVILFGPLHVPTSLL